MSVLIKDIEKPKSCYAVIDGEAEYCPFVNTDDDCVLLLKKGTCEGTWEEQYSKCPLVEAPEPCEDAVSRRRLLSDLKELTAAWKKYPVMAEQIKGVEAAIGYVETIPSVTPEQRWIPCTPDTMPDDLEEVNITFTNLAPEPYYDFIKGKCFTGSAVFYKGEWYWYSSITVDVLEEYGRYESEKIDEGLKIVAWMPLSEPYKEKDNERT